ncbi:DUF6300 family protein [Streptomyces sp. NBC_01474]|uniref:DUF6300 family protein n=1 Tax=Streptomyces sp. NBC_01474 TaxID=2903880 RepID=UPI002DD79F6B|nr:DUF6300 family protein [Streptomyces sp. NBC_01474]WSD92801.1 DUF6300 family protein [Streptomyces sp. NBC_01474]
MHGFKEAVLCAACDQDNPAAAELLALFAKNDGTSPGTMQAFGELAAAWVESVRHRTVDEVALDFEHKQWQRGEL